MEARVIASAVTWIVVLSTLGGAGSAFAREAPGDLGFPVATGACAPQDAACGVCTALTLSESCQPEGSPTAAACDALGLGPDCTVPDVCEALNQDPGCGTPDTAALCSQLGLTDDCQAPPDFDPTAQLCTALGLGADCTPPDVCDTLQQDPGCTTPDAAALCVALGLNDDCSPPEGFDPTAQLCDALQQEEGCVAPPDPATLCTGVGLTEECQVPPGFNPSDALCDALGKDPGCTSPDVCDALGMDADCLSPDPSGVPAQACDASGHEKTCAGLADAVAPFSDPSSPPEDAPGALQDGAQSAVGGACSDGNDATCASANETADDPTSVVPAFDVAGTAGTIKILDPAPQATNRSRLWVTFSTDLPANKTAGLVFFLANATPGTTTWTVQNTTECAGTGTRTCRMSWDAHAFTGDAAIRVSYTTQPCTDATCAVVTPIHLDNTPPKSRALAVGSVPAGTVNVPVSATGNDGGSIALYGRTTGAWQKLAEGPNGTSLTWTGATPGNWSLQTFATDKAGNVETKTTRAEARAAVAQFAASISSPLYFHNGETPTASVTVKQGGAAVADAVVTATLDGVETPLAYAGSGVYSASLDGPVSVAGIETHVLTVSVGSSGNLVSLPATLTYSPDRFVVLDVDSGGAGSTVPIGTTLLFTVTATYGDDGSPVDDLRIAATGGPADEENYTSVGSGVAFFEWTSHQAFAHAITFTALEQGRGAGAAPVWSAPVSLDVVWTRLLVASAPVPTAGFFNNVAADYTRGYCVSFEAGGPASGAFVQLTIQRNGVQEIAAEGATNELGCISMIVREDTVGTYAYTPSVEWDSPEGATFLASGGDNVVVHFTKVVLTLAASDAVVNETSATTFTVCGTYAHDANLKAIGAHVDVRTTESVPAVLESALLLGANGCATASHAFSGIFDASVTARLLDTLEGVTADAAPAGARIVATRITLAGAFNDTRVNVGDAPSLQGTAKFAHNGSNVPTGTFKVYRADDAAKTALATGSIANGAFSVAVPYSQLFAGAMAIDLLSASDDIDAQNAFTASAAWTEVDLALGAPDDTLVNSGDTVTIPVTATYADGVLASGAQVKATLGNKDGALLGTCVTLADGTCDLAVKSASVARGQVYVTSLGTAEGVTKAVAATSAQTIRWTELVVTYTTGTGPFNTGSGAGYHVTVTYADDGAPVADALVLATGFTVGSQSNYTDANGETNIPGIDTVAGTRGITLVVTQLDDGIDKTQVAGGATKQLRWTAIAFHDFEFDPAPVGYDENDEPVWATGTTVNVCVVAAAKDTDEILSGAAIYLRGVQKTTDANGRACVTVMKSNLQRSITATSHGVSATIGSKTITSSSDESVRMHFVAP